MKSSVDCSRAKHLDLKISFDSCILNSVPEKSLDKIYKTRRGGARALTRDYISGGYLNLHNIIENYETCQPSPVLIFFKVNYSVDV